MKIKEGKGRKKERKGKKIASNILFLIMVLGLTLPTASAATITVDPIGNGDYTSIQAAIDAADPEDTILVNSGTYTENLKIDKLLKLWSDSRNPENTLIRATNPNEPVIEIKASRTTLNGFGISGSDEAGIYLEGVEKCEISNNEISGAKTGLLLKDSGKNILTNNVISLNEKGVLLENSNENTIQKNTIAYNYGFGVSLEGSIGNQIYNNYLKNTENVEERSENSENAWGISISRDKNVVGGPFVSGNFWANPEGTGFSETGTDEDGNGLCDSRYEIMEGLFDEYPLYPKYPTGVENLETRLDIEGYEAGLAEREKMKVEEGAEGEDTVENESEADPNDTEDKEEEPASKENGGLPAPGFAITAAIIGTVYLLKRRRN